MLIQNCKIKETPTEKFPQMVTIVSECKKYSELWNKKFISVELAEKQILKVFGERLIASPSKKLKKLHNEFLIMESDYGSDKYINSEYYHYQMA
jgi:hypothetical protein|tara:strand:+ start:13672 stop:13953 length:282 start_codon:yes stop_codon:yes gene_type:complete